MTNRLKKYGLLTAAFLLLSVSIVFATGGYKVINFDTVKHPESLVKLLNAMYTEVTALRTLANELRTDHGTTITLDSAQTTLLNNIRTWTQAFPLGNPGFAINSNFDVQNTNAFSYAIAGRLYSQAQSQNFDTGTTATFPAGKWGICLLSLNAAGDETCTWATNTANAGYDSEALAIAALPATPAGHCPLGYITVQASAGNSFTAGTDALQGGTGGNASQDTNYYNMIDPQAVISAAVSASPPSAITAAAVTQQCQQGR